MDPFREAASEQFEVDRRNLLAPIGKAQATAYARKQTVDFAEVGIAWEQYFEEAGDDWRETFLPAIEGLIIAQGEEINAVLGGEFDVRNLFAEDWYDDYVMTFADEVVASTKETLNPILQQAMREGWSIPTMTERLESVFQQWQEGNLTPEAFDWLEERMPQHRREMIARTETIRASSKGSEALYRNYGIEQKEWWATKDDRVCPWCMEMHEELLVIGDNFFEQGDLMQTEDEGNIRQMRLDYESVSGPPLHPNCRCVLLPVV